MAVGTLPDHLLAVGQIAGVHGVKGWVKVHSATEPQVGIFSYQPWFVADRQGWQAVQIDDYRAQGKGYVAHIKGVDDRDVAQTYCRKDVCIEKTQLSDLADNEYYWHQLQGLKVFSTGDSAANSLVAPSEERVLLGKVAELMETGANDVLVVHSCAGSIDKRERLIPWLKQFLQNVDPGKGEIEVYWDPDF